MDTQPVTFHPPSASASGRNAFYIPHCRITEHSPAYCACLARIAHINARTDRGLFAECKDPVKHGTCPALTMQKDEELAGKALYFIARETIPISQSSLPTSAGGPAHLKSAPRCRPAPAPTAPLLVENGSYADAINAALAAPAAPAAAPAPTASEPAVPAPKREPGESPLLYARRIAATNQLQRSTT